MNDHQSSQGPSSHEVHILGGLVILEQSWLEGEEKNVGRQNGLSRKSVKIFNALFLSKRYLYTPQTALLNLNLNF